MRIDTFYSSFRTNIATLFGNGHIDNQLANTKTTVSEPKDSMSLDEFLKFAGAKTTSDNISETGLYAVVKEGRIDIADVKQVESTKVYGDFGSHKLTGEGKVMLVEKGVFQGGGSVANYGPFFVGNHIYKISNPDFLTSPIGYLAR